jgi:glycosyltransferase involved in cell wall biosynthesis
MKICLISGHKDNPDEGMKAMAFHISKELSKTHEILHINARENIFSINFWSEIKDFKPQILHFFLRPSVVTLSLAKALKLYLSDDIKLIITSLQPLLDYRYVRLCPSLFKPDLVLFQSYETEDMFRKLGYQTLFIPSGVDITKFAPVTNNIKGKLREKYHINKEKFVILHVGHINRGRHLEIFRVIAKNDENTEVILIGSTNTFNFDKMLYNELKNSGCRIFREYFESIEEMYQLSDCYIFPTIDRSYAIELPLSVLEAMACNLPVITTKFGGLNRIFKEEEGMIFVDSIDKIEVKLGILGRENPQINTRRQVLPYSWENVTLHLENIYKDLVFMGA